MTACGHEVPTTLPTLPDDPLSYWFPPSEHVFICGKGMIAWAKPNGGVTWQPGFLCQNWRCPTCRPSQVKAFLKDLAATPAGSYFPADFPSMNHPQWETGGIFHLWTGQIPCSFLNKEEHGRIVDRVSDRCRKAGGDYLAVTLIDSIHILSDIDFGKCTVGRRGRPPSAPYHALPVPLPEANDYLRRLLENPTITRKPSRSAGWRLPKPATEDREASGWSMLGAYGEERAELIDKIAYRALRQVGIDNGHLWMKSDPLAAKVFERVRAVVNRIGETEAAKNLWAAARRVDLGFLVADVTADLTGNGPSAAGLAESR